MEISPYRADHPYAAELDPTGAAAAPTPIRNVTTRGGWGSRVARLMTPSGAASALLGGSIRSASTQAHKKLTTLCTTLTDLHDPLLQRNSRTNITNALQNAIHAITDIMGVRAEEDLNPDQRNSLNLYLQHVLQLTPQQSPQMLTSLDTLLHQLKHYQAIMHGDRNSYCTRAYLQEYRETLITNLLNAEKNGLLDGLLATKDRLQGSFNNLGESIGEALVTTAVTRVGQGSQNILGFNPLRSEPTDEDVDLPIREIIVDEQGRELRRIDHLEIRPLTLAALIASTRDFIQRGDTDGFQGCQLSVWGSLLTCLKQRLEAQNQLAIDHPQRAGAITAAQVETNREVIPHITSALTVIANAQGVANVDLTGTFNQISELLGQHPIWITSFTEWNPFIQETGHQEIPTVETARRLIQMLVQTHPSLQAVETDIEPEIEGEVTKFIETSTYITTYKTLCRFAGPSSTGTPMKSFQEIMTGISSNAMNDAEREAEVLRRIGEEIDKRHDLTIFYRWILSSAASPLLACCKWAITRFSRGAQIFLQDWVEETDARSKAAIDQTPITSLTSVAATLYKARMDADLTPGDTKAIKHSLEEQNIHVGCGYANAKEMYEAFTDKAVDDLMIDFTPTSYLQNSANDLLTWANHYDDQRQQLAANILVALPRALLWLVNQTLIAPIAFIGNSLLKWSAKKLLKHSELVEGLVKMTSQSLFQEQETDFTEVMDEVTLNLIQMLVTKLDAPRGEGGAFSNLRENATTSRTLEACLNQVFDTIDLGQGRSIRERQQFNRGTRNWYQQLSSSLGQEVTPRIIHGVAGLLDRSYQLLMEKEMLNQQVYTLLKVTNESMLRQGRELTEAEKMQRSIAQGAKRAMLEQQVGLLLWKAIDMAGGLLSINQDQDQDAPIDSHVAKIKRDLLQGVPATDSGTPAIPGLIDDWRQQLTALDSHHPEANLECLTSIHRSLHLFLNDLQQELLTFRTEGEIGKPSLTLHEIQINSLIADLETFEIAFLRIYNRELHARVPREANNCIIGTGRILDTLTISLGDVESSPELLFPTIQNALTALRQTTTHLQELMQGHIPPATLTLLFRQLEQLLPHYEALMQIIEANINFTLYMEETLCPALRENIEPTLNFMRLQSTIAGQQEAIKSFFPQYNRVGSNDAIYYNRISSVLDRLNQVARQRSVENPATLIQELQTTAREIRLEKTHLIAATKQRVRDQLTAVATLAAEERRSLENAHHNAAGASPVDPIEAVMEDLTAQLRPHRESTLQQLATAQESLSTLEAKADQLHGIAAIHLDLLLKVPGYDMARWLAFTDLNKHLNLIIQDFVRNRPVFEKALVPRLVIQPFMKRQVSR